MEPLPIKVVRIIARLNIGGPAVHAVLLTEGLNGTEIRSTLIAGTVAPSEGDMMYFAQTHGVNPVGIPELGREISWRDDFVALWKIWRVLRTERPHIVHTHTAKAGTLGRIAAVFAGVPVRIHTFHGHVFHSYFGFIKTQVFLLIERGLALLTTKIVAISEAQLEELAVRYRIAPKSKFCVIPLGLDLAPLLAISRGEGARKIADSSTAIRIGFVGRLVPIKNPAMAVRVMKRLAEQKSCTQPIRLVVAGDGELKGALLDLIREAHLGEYVQLVGWQKTLAEFYAGMDLAILTSLNEGTPVALIEAMAAGLPFVTTRVGGIENLMQGCREEFRRTDGRLLFWLYANGALVEPNDEEGFEAAVAYLLQSAARRECMGQEGRRFVKQQFSKDRLVNDMQTFYRQCLRISASV